MDKNKKTKSLTLKSLGWKMRPDDSFVETSLNDMAKTGKEAGEALKKMKMSQQEIDQHHLKHNLAFILEHFDEYISKESRPNYLMAISISCKPGGFIRYYGSNPVNEEMKKCKKELKQQKKNK